MRLLQAGVHRVQAVVRRVRAVVRRSAEEVKGAPYSTPVRRLDDVRAARQLDLTWTPEPAA